LRARVDWTRRRFTDLGDLLVLLRGSPRALVPSLIRSIQLIARDRYAPAEIGMLGLLGQHGAIDETRLVSKRRMVELQHRVNPREQWSSTGDKLIFYHRCQAHGLATPHVFAALCREPCPAEAIPRVDDPAALLALLGGQPREFVLKPVGGSHGRGVLLLRFDGTAFVDQDGDRRSAADLFAYADASGDRTWLFQERLYPHSSLVRLSGSPYLQTARIVTWLERDGSVRIPFAWLRIIVGSSAFDNFNFGTSGNLTATVDVPTGRLVHVLGPVHGTSIAPVAVHPTSGASFEDFVVPLMPEVRDLAMRAAPAFAPLRTVGWDIGVTEQGPYLVEGNAMWDPMPTLEDFRSIVASLR
jgi:hypothetical protein